MGSKQIWRRRCALHSEPTNLASRYCSVQQVIIFIFVLGCSLVFLHNIYMFNKKKKSHFSSDTPLSHHLAALCISIWICLYNFLYYLWFIVFFFTSTSLYTSSLSIISHLIDTLAMKCRDRITSMMLFCLISLLVIALIGMHYLGTDTSYCYYSLRSTRW